MLAAVWLSGAAFFALLSLLDDVPRAWRHHREGFLSLPGLVAYTLLTAAVCLLWPAVAAGAFGYLGWKQLRGEL